MARRVDFIYARGEVAAAWHDRCYRAHLVKRWKCGPRRAVFANRKGFLRCERRSLHHGRPGDGCPAAHFRRYYSDHPILLATLR